MQFEDSDRLPKDLIEVGLGNIRKRYGAVIDDSVRVEADDWDRIPQPARAMAFLSASTATTAFGVRRRVRTAIRAAVL